MHVLVTRAQLHQIAELVNSLLASDSFCCLDAEFEAHTQTLRLFIDHPNGVDLDACARVSNFLVERTELDALILGDFNLEISSPGVERPIRTLKDFQAVKDEGCQIKVGLTEKFMNRRKGSGTVINIDDEGLISMSTTEGAWSFPWSLVLKATKVVDWSKAN